MPRRIESVFLAGPTGRLEALLNFFHRLLHGVADFRQIDLGYDVEAVIWHKLVAQGRQYFLSEFVEETGQFRFDSMLDGGANVVGS